MAILTVAALAATGFLFFSFGSDEQGSDLTVGDVDVSAPLKSPAHAMDSSGASSGRVPSSALPTRSVLNTKHGDSRMRSSNTESTVDLGLVDSFDDAARMASQARDDRSRKRVLGAALDVCSFTEGAVDTSEVGESGGVSASSAYFRSFQTRFCSNVSESETEDYWSEFAASAGEMTELERELVEILSAADQEALDLFVEEKLKFPGSLGELSANLGALNAAFGSDWDGGGQFLPDYMASPENIAAMRSIASEMLACEAYGGCGVLDPITMASCRMYDVCRPNMTMLEVWQERYGEQHIDAARRFADYLTGYAGLGPLGNG